ncbi:MAG: hypothetical protein EOL88_02455 [Bacteroidia bacterium]|nr:hypothetical protein [Bacteroidia bacterium]
MAMYVMANQEYHVWGRRTGKSHGLTGPRALTNVFTMPRSYGAFVGPSYKMMLSQTLPTTLNAWKYFGIYENVHYVLNKKPSDKLGWQRPFIEPRSYENTISFYNGSIIVLISQDKIGSSNSRSIDWIIVDEAKFINYERFKNETIPALSGSVDSIRAFREHPRFKSALYCTDMPILKRSQWILDFEKKMDKDLIDLILQTRKALITTKSKHATNILQKQIDNLRKNALYYSEANVIDNVEIVGEKYIRDQQRNLPEFEFRTSILNIRPGKTENGFYSSLNENHYYTASNVNYLESIMGRNEFKYKMAEKQDCRMDGDLDHTKPLGIAFDYNANINWIVVGQSTDLELKVVNSMYVKTPRKLRELVNDFCDYYEYFTKKSIDYFYDTTALKGNYAVSDEGFNDVVSDQLIKRGWSVNQIYIGQPMKHNLKHLYIDQALKGQKYLYPTFNKINNERLIFALEQAGVRIGKNGFEKDKSGEKLQETPEDLLETRTDATDAFDTLFVGFNFFKNKLGQPGYMSGSVFLR